MTLNIADRQRELDWTGVLPAYPYIEGLTADDWEMITAATYTPHGEDPADGIPRARDSDDDNGITTPDSHKNMILTHGSGQRHRLYKQVAPRGPLYWSFSQGGGFELFDQCRIDGDMTPFFNSYPSGFAFLPLADTFYFITRHEGYRMQPVETDDGFIVQTSVVRDSLWQARWNIDGTIELIGGEIDFAERWAWIPSLSLYNIPLTERKFEQLSLLYRCSRIVIYRDAIWDGEKVVLPGSPEYILRQDHILGDPIPVDPEHLQFEPLNFYGQEKDTVHECNFTPLFPSPITAWQAGKSVTRFDDIAEVTGGSLTGALNNPSGDDGHTPLSDESWLAQVNTDAIERIKFSEGNAAILFGTTSPSLPFDIMIEMDIWYYKRITGTFYEQGGEVMIDKQSSAPSFAHITGEVFYCV